MYKNVVQWFKLVPIKKFGAWKSSKRRPRYDQVMPMRGPAPVEGLMPASLGQEHMCLPFAKRDEVRNDFTTSLRNDFFTQTFFFKVLSISTGSSLSKVSASRTSTRKLRIQLSFAFEAVKKLTNHRKHMRKFLPLKTLDESRFENLWKDFLQHFYWNLLKSIKCFCKTVRRMFFLRRLCEGWKETWSGPPWPLPWNGWLSAVIRCSPFETNDYVFFFQNIRVFCDVLCDKCDKCK